MKQFAIIKDEKVISIEQHEVRPTFKGLLSVEIDEDSTVSEGMAYIEGQFIAISSVELKEEALSLLWKMIPKKIIGSKKQIIDKPKMTDEELISQLSLYEKKYTDAKAGLDVFEAQATLASLSQEDFRNLVITKGDAFKLAEKKIDDLIESVRQLMESQAAAIETQENFDKYVQKIILLDEFSILTPPSEIFEALKG